MSGNPEEDQRAAEEAARLAEAAARVPNGNRRRPPEEAAGRQFQPRTLRDYHVPRADDAQGPILLPEVRGDPPNFGSGVVNLIQQNCFHGLETENPHDHLNNFLQCCRTVNNVNASPDYVSLALFHFSLRDRARTWCLPHLPLVPPSSTPRLFQGLLTRSWSRLLYSSFLSSLYSLPASNSCLPVFLASEFIPYSTTD